MRQLLNKEMNSQLITERLAGKGIRPTSNRILVYDALARQESPQSLKDMENLLLSMDKSSIFRVLTLFLKHDVVHAFEDGRGVMNYELCNEQGECHHHDNHVHFYCEVCGRSFCMEDVPIPSFCLPSGFRQHSASFVIKGECPNCSSKKPKTTL